MSFSSIKEINRYFKHLLLRKTDVLKHSILLERKFEEMHYLWRAKRYKVYLSKRLFLHYRLQLFFVYKTLRQICLSLFCLGYNRILLEFVKKWGSFHGHNGRFPKYLHYKLKFQKSETWFCWSKSTNNNDINIFLSLENPCTFLLAKEKT